MPRYRLHDTLTFALADGGELVVEHGSTVFFDGAAMAGMKALRGSHPRSYNHAGLKALLIRRAAQGRR